MRTLAKDRVRRAAGITAAAAAGVLVLLGLALIFVSVRGGVGTAGPITPASSTATQAVARSGSARFSSPTTEAVLGLVDRGRQKALPLAETIEATTVAAVVATVKPRKIPPAKPSGPSLDAYRGLGSWVDIYDDRAWNDPAGAVRDMKRHGVRTLFLETGNSASPMALKDTAKLQTFIRESHAHGIKVVAWYLADLTDVAKDYGRISAAIKLRTADGQRIDSFALDIESTVVASEKTRNRALLDLSRQIRARQGKTYPLGAITPSPVGIATNAGYWPGFPYGELSGIYNVWVPMSYYTYHGKGGGAASRDTLANVKILSSLKARPRLPIHLIGGISDSSTPAEVGEFVKAAVKTKVIGASLYGWAGTSDAAWAALKAIK
jgi:hypothetical protein